METVDNLQSSINGNILRHAIVAEDLRLHYNIRSTETHTFYLFQYY